MFGLARDMDFKKTVTFTFIHQNAKKTCIKAITETEKKARTACSSE